MAKAYKIFYVDDEPLFLKIMVHVFEKAGHTIVACTDSTKALDEIKRIQPDCVITDLMMPSVDGMELITRIRADESLNHIKIIVSSCKSYEYDKIRAYKLGADGYILKSTPVERILEIFLTVLEDKVEITFWGTRGTLPVCGQKNLRYGGNTACVSMQFGKDNFFIFDAGTGIKELSDSVMKSRRSLTKAKLFISHPHWDHINAFPFFVPLFIPGNDIEVMGAAHGNVGIESLLSHQMDGVYFPINIKEFGAHVHFRNLSEESFEIEGIKIRTMLLKHPGNCLGFRIEYNGKIMCYVTDNELYPDDCPFFDASYVKHLTGFVADADVLITDVCYSDAEYPRKINWGHSRPLEVCRLAHDAKVKRLYLFHHDPSQDDVAIEAKLAEAQKHLAALGSQTVALLAGDQAVLKL